VLAAIEAAISGTLGDGEQQEWSIQYHEATHIAFINVSESMADAAEEAIEQVADALFSGIRSRAHVGGDDDELVELHMELEEVVEQYAAMQDALAELEDEIAQLRGINEQLERALNATRQSGNADGRD
jgi:septal ring factor EnvC (AmiA/AmiB activator)